MPRQYEAIRDKFIDEGMSTKEAKTRAARIYNATHKGNPVTPVSRLHERLRKRRRAKK